MGYLPTPEKSALRIKQAKQSRLCMFRRFGNTLRKYWGFRVLFGIFVVPCQCSVSGGSTRAAFSIRCLAEGRWSTLALSAFHVVRASCCSCNRSQPVRSRGPQRQRKTTKSVSKAQLRKSQEGSLSNLANLLFTLIYASIYSSIMYLSIHPSIYPYIYPSMYVCMYV